MFISNITMKNFRNFKSNSINFNNGMNVIIGHNNAGKSNLLKALSLVFNNKQSKRLIINDFNKNTELRTLKQEPPGISISITLSQEENEDLISDDLITISSWLTKLEEPYEAKLHYNFYLPNSYHEEYINSLSEVTDINQAWQIIEEEFLRLYMYKIWGGNPLTQNIAEADLLNKFDFQFLDAIRDVERDMFSGKSTLLKNVLDFFMDYEIKSNTSLEESDKKKAIKKKRKDFGEQSRNLMELLKSRIDEGKGQILSYASDIGASFNDYTPNFDGNITDSQLYSALKLIIENQSGIKMPITNNGLGYNNLIFMSLLLARMQVETSEEYLGNNAKIFPMLIIEEPESHLHPTMQRQLLTFLTRNLEDKKVRQMFITTHSTHITGSVHLDHLICLYDDSGTTAVSYPGKVFESNIDSKHYVERFLDATKSNMLFAEKIIFVEGLAEQLMMSVFANHLKYSLEDNHVAVINVGGKYFDHFLHLFNTYNPNSINRKIACITDIDPSRRELDTTNQTSFKKCYPYELHVSTNFEYKINTPSTNYPENIEFFMPDSKYGKTLEYELVRSNPTYEKLVTNSTNNQNEIKNLMKDFAEGKSINDMLNRLRLSEENERISTSISDEALSWPIPEKKIAIIASRYLNSVGKGINALELAHSLEKDLLNTEKRDSDSSDDIIFKVPSYIKNAIDWIDRD